MEIKGYTKILFESNPKEKNIKMEIKGLGGDVFILLVEGIENMRKAMNLSHSELEYYFIKTIKLIKNKKKKEE